MRWVGYVLGLTAGGVLGYWVHDFWEGDLTGVGAARPPSFDFYVPLLVFVLATVFVATRRKD